MTAGLLKRWILGMPMPLPQPLGAWIAARIRRAQAEAGSAWGTTLIVANVPFHLTSSRALCLRLDLGAGRG